MPHQVSNVPLPENDQLVRIENPVTIECDVLGPYSFRLRQSKVEGAEGVAAGGWAICELHASSPESLAREIASLAAQMRDRGIEMGVARVRDALKVDKRQL